MTAEASRFQNSDNSDSGVSALRVGSGEGGTGHRRNRLAGAMTIASLFGGSLMPAAAGAQTPVCSNEIRGDITHTKIGGALSNLGDKLKNSNPGLHDDLNKVGYRSSLAPLLESAASDRFICEDEVEAARGGSAAPGSEAQGAVPEANPAPQAASPPTEPAKPSPPPTTAAPPQESRRPDPRKTDGCTDGVLLYKGDTLKHLNTKKVATALQDAARELHVTDPRKSSLLNRDVALEVARLAMVPPDTRIVCAGAVEGYIDQAVENVHSRRPVTVWENPNPTPDSYPSSPQPTQEEKSKKDGGILDSWQFKIGAATFAAWVAALLTTMVANEIHGEKIYPLPPLDDDPMSDKFSLRVNSDGTVTLVVNPGERQVEIPCGFTFDAGACNQVCTNAGFRIFTEMAPDVPDCDGKQK